MYCFKSFPDMLSHSPRFDVLHSNIDRSTKRNRTGRKP